MNFNSNYIGSLYRFLLSRDFSLQNGVIELSLSVINQQPESITVIIGSPPVLFSL